MSKQFGDRLKDLRTEKKMTQEELAKLFNTGKASISNYEKNTRLPDGNTIARYAEYFDVSVDYMMGRSEVKKPEVLELDSAYLRLMQDAKKKNISAKDIERMIKFLEEAKSNDHE